MFKTMTIFMYVSTIVAIVSTAIVCVNYMIKKKSKGIDYTALNTQIGTCRFAAVVFTILAWLVTSCEKKAECLAGYRELSTICSRLGIIWIGYAFACIGINVIMINLKKDPDVVKGLTQIRNSGFGMGALFLVISFLLNV